MPHQDKPQQLCQPAWQSTLRSYQLRAAQWLADGGERHARGLLLALRVGFGKTRPLIAGARLRHESGAARYKPIIVFCPASVKSVWKREASIVWPELPVYLLADEDPTARRKGEDAVQFIRRRNEKLIAALNDSEWPCLIVSSYQGAARIHECAPQLLGTVICDEAHSIKTDRTQRTQTIRPLLGRSERFFLATGTPIHNRIMDLYALLDMIVPGKFGGRYRFAEKYCQITQNAYGKKIERVLDKDGLARDVAPYVFTVSTKEAYGSLPLRVRTLVPVEVKPNVSTDSVSDLDLLRTKKGSDRILRTLAKYKVNAAVQLAIDLDEPLLIYTYMREHARLVQKKLIATGVDARLATGDLPPKQRTKLLDAWQYESAGKILCCTMDAVTEGVTLTRASATIFADLDNLPGKMDQCEGRTDSSRQPENERRPSRYYYLTCSNSYDEVVAQRIMDKIADANGIVGTNENLSSMGDLLSNFVPHEDPQAVLDDLVARIEARAARLEEI